MLLNEVEPTMQSMVSSGVSVGRYGSNVRSTYSLLEIRDKIITVFVLLQTGECHLRARNVLLIASG